MAAGMGTDMGTDMGITKDESRLKKRYQIASGNGDSAAIVNDQPSPYKPEGADKSSNGSTKRRGKVTK